jgi:hypothetical protein
VQGLHHHVHRLDEHAPHADEQEETADPHPWATDLLERLQF